MTSEQTPDPRLEAAAEALQYNDNSHLPGDELSLGFYRLLAKYALAAADRAAPPATYELAGYFRFIESDTPGVVGEVRSTHAEGWADDSDVPVYRIPGETKANRIEPTTTSEVDRLAEGWTAADAR